MAVSSESGEKLLTAIFLSSLMIFLGIAAATDALIDNNRTTLPEKETVNDVILHLSQLNKPGFQEGSVFTDTTLSAGGMHTCAILDNGSVSCWGRGSNGQLGNGETSNKGTPTLTSSLGIGRTAVAISSGAAHTCAILDNGDVSCWGDGVRGQLGNGGTSDKSTPTLTSSLGTGRTAVAISSGEYHTCAILDNGQVSCWGLNSDGQLGNGGTTDKNTPTLTSSLGPGRTAVAISSGYGHTCAILDNGSVSCWGRAYYGHLSVGGTALGNGETEPFPPPETSPTLTSSLGTGRTAVAISSGDDHTCAILDNGSVSCWGSNVFGELGNGGNSNKNTPTLTSSLGANRTAVSLSSGGYHTCAILDNGSVSCWGSGRYGTLGDGGTTDKNTSTLTNSLGTGRTAVAISSGEYHTCAILDNGSVSCWGLAGYRLGNGVFFGTFPPTLTSSLGSSRTAALSERDFDGDGTYTIFQAHSYLDIQEQSISSGGGHTCAILNNGSVSCWGEGVYGQLGNGRTTNMTTPTPIGNLGTNRTAVALSAGYYHTCAILDNGSVSCWGRGDNGQLGNGGTENSTLPVTTSSLGAGRTAVSLSSGASHTCALLDNGLISCWGFGDYGQMGNGGTTSTTVPTLTSSLGTGRTAIALSSGQDHTCALLDNGSVSCWGSSHTGQLGNGGSYSLTPTLTGSFGTGRTAVALSSGSFHTCAILDNGAVSCWGMGWHGQLGNGGAPFKQNTPVLVSSLGSGRTALAISAGFSHTCAILDNGLVSCWGAGTSQGGGGDYGQLGNGGSTGSAVPTLTSSLGTGRTAVALSSGVVHTCAVLDSGQVSCWGYGDPGQLGNGGTSNKRTPTPTSSLGTNRTVMMIDGDRDGDGVYDPADAFPADSIRSVKCDAGQYGRYICLDSPAGKYVPTSGSMYATEASRGYFVPSTGQSSQIACAAGTFQPDVGQTSCDDADAGFHVPNLAQTSQTACQPGTYQPLQGQPSCRYADAGYYVDQTAAVSQTACDAGTFNPNTGSSTSSACVDAEPGHYVPTQGQIKQTACAVGTYQPNSGRTSCDDADAGFHVPITAQASQTACPRGTYQPLQGQPSCDDADAGYYVDETAGTTQTACDAGTFNPNTGSSNSSACVDADPGHFVPAQGQANQTACAVGTYQPNSGRTSCDDAYPGYYVSDQAQTNQTACQFGTFQPLQGQASCDDADAGYYVDETAATSQNPCAIGTYQPTSGQVFCDDASPGHYVSSPGQSDQTACMPGTYQPRYRQASCEVADAGHYVNQTAQTSQMACEAGTYNPNEGGQSHLSCLLADVGHFVPLEALTDQIRCPVGTYADKEGSIGCKEAAPGYMVSSTASVSAVACPLGAYQPASGADACIPAERGFFVPITASTNQTPCPVGTTTLSEGSMNATSCLEDADSDGLANIVDDDDDNDGVVDDQDAFPLDASASKPGISTGLIGVMAGIGLATVGALAIRHRRMGDQQSPSGVDSGTDGVAHLVGEKIQPDLPPLDGAVAHFPVISSIPTPSVIENYTQLPHGGSYDQSTGETVYAHPDGRRWRMMPDGRFVQME